MANPHRGPVGARLREPEEASRPQLQTRPALVQAMRAYFERLTPTDRCASIFVIEDRNDPGLSRTVRNSKISTAGTILIEVGAQRLPRNRMGGQGKRVRVAVVTPARPYEQVPERWSSPRTERWSHAAHRPDLSLASRETPNQGRSLELPQLPCRPVGRGLS